MFIIFSNAGDEHCTRICLIVAGIAADTNCWLHPRILWFQSGMF